MLKKIKTKLWFIYRWVIWIKDNILDNPEIGREWKYSFPTVIWRTVNWQDIQCYTFWNWEEKILYFWGIHGNEIGTVKLMNRWVNYLNSNVGTAGLPSLQQKTQSYSKYSWYRIYSDTEWNNLKSKQKTGHMIVWAEEKWVDVIEIETRTRWWSEWEQNKKALIESLKL